ncbi:MAG TPA: hypothetical protein VJV23_09615 [Candidatus Polarisedimenticolia bacterium]|nr:hypothetical protein [Candidatus Polarisedimenticolia bacterium]
MSRSERRFLRWGRAWPAVLALAAWPPAAAAGPAASPPGPVQGALREAGEAAERSRAGRYLVVSSPAEGMPSGLAARMASLAERFEHAYRAFWEGRLPLAPAAELPAEVAIVILPGAEPMGRLLGEARVRRPAFEPGGAWLPLHDMILVARTSLLERVLAATVVHETAHMLNERMLRGAGMAWWLDEGLAQFCQYSALDPGGGPRLGTLDEGSVLRVPEGEGEILYQFVPRRSLSYLDGQFRRDPSLSIAQMLADLDPAPERARLREVQAWSFVHLMAVGRTRRQGPLRPRFDRYVAMELAGEGGRQPLLGVLDMSMEELDNLWYRHVMKLL